MVFKIKMIKKGAEVIFSDQSRLFGKFFVSPQSSTHAGNESVSDLLNNKKPYIPFELKEGEIVMLQKKCIVRIILEEKERNKGLTCQKQIMTQLCFLSGEAIDGKVCFDLPKSNSRLSDFLNYSGDFFYFDGKDSYYLVNSRFVKMVRPHFTKK